MRPIMLLGALLIGVGVIAFTCQGINYTTREKVVDIGAMHITTEKKNTIPLTPIVGLLALTGGALMLVLGRRGA
jgi:hypothetical protein